MITIMHHRSILFIILSLPIAPSGFAETSNSVVLSGKVDTSSDSESFNAFLCDAAVSSGNAGDGVHLQVHNDAIEKVRFTLGSERYGAEYSAILCLTLTGKNGDIEKNNGKKSAMAFTLTLGTSNVVEAHSSYAELSQLTLMVHVVCADNSSNQQLYSGPFQGLPVTMKWKMMLTGTTCKLTLSWRETSTQLRSWGGTPTAITGFLSGDPKE